MTDILFGLYDIRIAGDESQDSNQQDIWPKDFTHIAPCHIKS